MMNMAILTDTEFDVNESMFDCWNHDDDDDGIVISLNERQHESQSDNNAIMMTAAMGSKVDQNGEIVEEERESAEIEGDSSDEDGNEGGEHSDDDDGEREEKEEEERMESKEAVANSSKRKCPSSIVARAKELGILDKFPEFQTVQDPNDRKWTQVQSVEGTDKSTTAATMAMDIEEVTIETRTRSEGSTMGTFPNMFSSLKYEIIQCITTTGTTEQSEQPLQLYYRIAVVDSETGEEIRVNLGRREAIKGDTKGKMELSIKEVPAGTTTPNSPSTSTSSSSLPPVPPPSSHSHHRPPVRRSARLNAKQYKRSPSSGNKMGTVKNQRYMPSPPSQCARHYYSATSRIQFSTVSFHFGKKKFCLQISYYRTPDVSNAAPVYTVRSAPFEVFARRVSGVLYRLEQKISEFENNNGSSRKRKLDERDGMLRKRLPRTADTPQSDGKQQRQQQQHVSLQEYVKELEKLLQMRNLIPQHERHVADRKTIAALCNLGAQDPFTAMATSHPYSPSPNLDRLLHGQHLADVSSSLLSTSMSPSSEHDDPFLSFPWQH